MWIMSFVVIKGGAVGVDVGSEVEVCVDVGVGVEIVGGIGVDIGADINCFVSF